MAKTADGQEVSLLFRRKEEITKWRKQPWYCRNCGQPVILKNGPVKLAHFSHGKKSVCQVFSEGETAEHLAGKAYLAKWCQRYEIPYVLEAYLPDLKQRPDLLIKGTLAIEFQCSSLSLARLAERTATYQRHGYTVMWILGKRYFLGKRITAFQRSCVNYHQNCGFYFWELDVEQQRLSCLTHLEEIQASRELLFTRKSWPWGATSLLRVLTFPQTAQLFVRRQHKSLPLLLKNFAEIEQNLAKGQRGTLDIQEQLYRQGAHLRELDICFFLPVTQPLLAKESIYLWRLLVWQILEQQPILSLTELRELFQQRFAQLKPGCYLMPLVALDTNLALFLNDYIRLLCQLSYVVIKGQLIFLKRPRRHYSDYKQREVAAIQLLANYNHISVTPHKNML